jgi:uncharacterized protein with PQ loop repeat
MHVPLIHLHWRKRAQLKEDPYPHPHKWVHFLDDLILIIAVIGPLMTVPQIYTLYFENNVSGVSPITWSMFAFFNVFWIIYGWIHKDKRIFLAYCLWFIVNSTVAIGALTH